MIKNKLCALIILMVCMVLPLFVNAQVDPGEDPDAPIDGGIGVLVAAGVAYGYKKYTKSKSNNDNAV